MQYSIEIDGKEFNLSPYTVDISEQIEYIETKNNGPGKFREKLKNMYDFLVKTVDGAAEYLGDFRECDPNKINLMFLRIIRSYNGPVENYEREQTNRQFDDESVGKVIKLLELMSTVDAKSLAK